MVRLVKKVSKVTAISLGMVSLISMLTYILMVNYEQNTKPGQFNFPVFTRDIGVCCLLFMLTISAWYVNSISEGTVIADDYPLFCGIFKFWDGKNREVYPDKPIEETNIVSISYRRKTSLTFGDKTNLVCSKNSDLLSNEY